MKSLYESIRARVLEKGYEIDPTCDMEMVTIPTLKDFIDIVGDRLDVNLPFHEYGFIYDFKTRSMLFKNKKKAYTVDVCIPVEVNVRAGIPKKINPTNVGNLIVGYMSFSVQSEKDKPFVLHLIGNN